MYAAWRKDPTSVHVSWYPPSANPFALVGVVLIFRQAYFSNMADPSRSPKTAFQPPPTLIPSPAGGAPSLIPGDSQGVDNDVTDHLKVQLLVRAYQVPPSPHPTLELN
jgi:2-oxoglutarate dehydrogenase E1 component